MTIDHRLYKNGELTRAGENFAYTQQERLENFSEEDKEQEFSKILDGLQRELKDKNSAQTVMDAIKEFMEAIEGYLGEAIY